MSSLFQEHKQKPPLESYLWLHLLAQQADIREREWGEIRRCGLEGWEVVKRQWEQLQVQLRLRREAWRVEHAKLLSTLLSEPSSQNLRKLVVTYKKSASGDSKAGNAPEKSPGPGGGSAAPEKAPVSGCLHQCDCF